MDNSTPTTLTTAGGGGSAAAAAASRARLDAWAVRWSTIEEEAELLTNRLAQLSGTVASAEGGGGEGGKEDDAAQPTGSDASGEPQPDANASSGTAAIITTAIAPSCVDVLVLESFVEEVAAVERQCLGLMQSYETALTAMMRSTANDKDNNTINDKAHDAHSVDQKEEPCCAGLPPSPPIAFASPSALASLRAQSVALLGKARAINARLPMIATTAALTIHEKLEGCIVKGLGYVAASGVHIDEAILFGGGEEAVADADDGKVTVSPLRKSNRHLNNTTTSAGAISMGNSSAPAAQQRLSYGGEAFLREVGRYTDTQRIALIKDCRVAMLALVKEGQAMAHVWGLDDEEEAAKDRERAELREREKIAAAAFGGDGNDDDDAGAGEKAPSDAVAAVPPPSATTVPSSSTVPSVSAPSSSSSSLPTKAGAVRALIPSAFDGPTYSHHKVTYLLALMEEAEAILWRGKNAAAKEDVQRLQDAAKDAVAQLERYQRLAEEDPILVSPARAVDPKDGRLTLVGRPDAKHTDLDALKARLEMLEDEDDREEYRAAVRKGVVKKSRDRAFVKKAPFVVLPSSERRALVEAHQLQMQKEFRHYEAKRFEHEKFEDVKDVYVIGDEAYLPSHPAALGGGGDASDVAVAAAESNALLIGSDDDEGSRNGTLRSAAGTAAAVNVDDGDDAARSPPPTRGLNNEATARRFIAKFGTTLFTRTKVDAVLPPLLPTQAPNGDADGNGGGAATVANALLLSTYEKQRRLLGPHTIHTDTHHDAGDEARADGGGAEEIAAPVDENDDAATTEPSRTVPLPRGAGAAVSALSPSALAKANAANSCTTSSSPNMFKGYDRRDSLMARSAAEKVLQTRNSLEHFKGPIADQSKKVANAKAYGISTLLVPGGEYVLGHLNPKESATLLPIAESFDKSSRLDRRTNYWLSSNAPSIIAGTGYAGGEQHFMYTTAPRHVCINDWAVSTRPITVRQFMTAVKDTRLRAEMERILLTLSPSMMDEANRSVYSPIMAPDGTGYLEGFIVAVERRHRDKHHVMLRPGSALATVQSALTGGGGGGGKGNNNGVDEETARELRLKFLQSGDSYVPDGARSPRSMFLETLKNDPSDVGYTDDTIEVPYFIAEAFSRALGGVVCPPDVWEAMACGVGGDKQHFLMPNIPNVPSTLGLHQLQWTVTVDGGHRPVKGSSWRVTEAEGLRFLRSQEGQYGHELIGRCGHEWNQSLDVTFRPQTVAEREAEEARIIDLRALYDKRRADAVPKPTPQEILAGRRADGTLIPHVRDYAVDALSTAVAGSASTAVDKDGVPVGAYTRRHDAGAMEELGRHTKAIREKIVASGLEPPAFVSWRPTNCSSGAAGTGASHILRSTSDHMTQTLFSGDVTGVVTFQGDDYREVVLPPPNAKCYDNEHTFTGPNFHTFSLPHHGAPIAAFRIAFPSCGEGQQRLEEALYEYDRRLGRHVTFADIVRGMGRGRGTLAGGPASSPASPTAPSAAAAMPAAMGDGYGGHGGYLAGSITSPSRAAKGGLKPLGGATINAAATTTVVTAGGSVQRAGRIGGGGVLGLSRGGTTDMNEGEGFVGGDGFSAKVEPLLGDGWLANVEPDLVTPSDPSEDAKYKDTHRWVLAGAGLDMCFGDDAPHPLLKVVLYGPHKGLPSSKLPVTERWMCASSIRGTLPCHMLSYGDVVASRREQRMNRGVPASISGNGDDDHLLANLLAEVGDQRYVPYFAGGGTMPVLDGSEGIVIRTDSLDAFCYSLPLSGQALIEADDAIRQAHTDGRMYREYLAAEEKRKADYSAMIKAAKNNITGTNTSSAEAASDPIVKELRERRRSRRGSTVSKDAGAHGALPPKRRGTVGGDAASAHHPPSTAAVVGNTSVSSVAAFDGESDPTHYSPDGLPIIPTCLLRIVEDTSYRMVYTDRVTIRPANDPRHLLPDIVVWVEVTWRKGYDAVSGGPLVTEVSVALAKKPMY